MSTVQTPHIRRSWRALFDEPHAADAEALARCWVTPPGDRSSPAGRLHPQALRGASVLCRPGTTDAQVFDDTFVGLYHLPPIDLPEDATILDLGGNVGYTAAHFAALCPRGTVVCVEMDAANAQAARDNLAPFGPRCRVIEAAAWDRDGEIVYGGTEEWGFRVASLSGDTPTPLGDRRVRARALSMETLLREAGLSGRVIDFIKIDVEGAEAAIVTEGASWLSRARCIKLEYHPPATRQSMAAVLTKAGFEVRDDDKHQRCVIALRR